MILSFECIIKAQLNQTESSDYAPMQREHKVFISFSHTVHISFSHPSPGVILLLYYIQINDVKPIHADTEEGNGEKTEDEKILIN